MAPHHHDLSSLVMPVALAIGIAHLIVGICILFEPKAMLVTSFAGLRWIMTVYNSGDKLGGLLLMLVGAAAIVGGSVTLSRMFDLDLAARLRLIAPQVIILVFTLASLIETIIVGHYPDGYEPTGGWVFILADQIVAGAVSAFHVYSILMLPMRYPRNTDSGSGAIHGNI